MQQYVGCDSHRDYSVFVGLDEHGYVSPAQTVRHERAEFRAFLKTLPPGTPVAIESTGGWYWLVDELEAAGLEPHLAHAFAAKQRMAGRKKTDSVDAKGLAILLRNGTLPEVWIPPGPLRDLRGLLRTRLSLREHSTMVKCRILSAVNRYGLRDDRMSDLFRGKGRVRLSVYIASLPDQTQEACIHEWELVDQLRAHLEALEEHIRRRIGRIGWVRLLKSIPGVGEILGATIHLEVGDVKRFPTAGHLASYSGLLPAIHSSGGKSWHGPTPQSANQFLKWAFVEAANVIVCHQDKFRDQHVGKLYQRLRSSKCHGKAVVAVARHLAEASWWILSTGQKYREPAPTAMSSSKHG
jgi:transposase